MPYENVHVMRDCFLPTHIALGLSLHSPFKEAIDLRLEGMKEAGLVRTLCNLDSCGAGIIMPVARGYYRKVYFYFGSNQD